MQPNFEKAQQIRELKAQGLRQQDIADIFGCTQGAIKNMSKTHGIIWNRGAAARDQRGEKNPNYKGGISRSTIQRLAGSNVLKDKRSLNICERCRSTSPTCIDHHVHHKNRNRLNNEAANLEVLCLRCHTEEHRYDKR